jgi:hypothetical protein
VRREKKKNPNPATPVLPAGERKSLPLLFRAPVSIRKKFAGNFSWRKKHGTGKTRDTLGLIIRWRGRRTGPASLSPDDPLSLSTIYHHLSSLES